MVLGASVLGGPAGVVLPWVALGVLIGGFVWLARKNRDRQRLAAGVEHVGELSARRHHAAALRQAWMMLPRAVRLPGLHVRLVTIMGQALAGVRRYDAALRCYDDAIRDLQPGHPIAIQLHIAKAQAQLHTEHLSDADDTLRRLRGTADVDGKGQGHPVSAAYATAKLLQAVKTHHYSDAIEEGGRDGEAWLERLRPLGVEAGYGYGMLTLCFAELASRAEDQEQREGWWEAARRWWGRATLLMPRQAIMYRVPELRRWVEDGGELRAAETANPLAGGAGAGMQGVTPRSGVGVKSERSE